MTRHAEVAASADVQARDPGARRAGRTASATGRCATWARIGGSLANNDPAADYPARGAGAQRDGASPNKRKIAADEFFKGLYETALAARRADHGGEHSRSPKAALREVSATRRRASRWSACSSRRLGRQRARRRHRRRRRAASGRRRWKRRSAPSFTPEAVASIKVKPAGLNNDLHASPEYRAHLITVMCKRAVEQALK